MFGARAIPASCPFFFIITSGILLVRCRAQKPTPAKIQAAVADVPRLAAVAEQKHCLQGPL